MPEICRASASSAHMARLTSNEVCLSNVRSAKRVAMHDVNDLMGR